MHIMKSCGLQSVEIQKIRDKSEFFQTANDMNERDVEGESAGNFRQAIGPLSGRLDNRKLAVAVR